MLSHFDQKQCIPYQTKNTEKLKKSLVSTEIAIVIEYNSS